MDQIKHTFNSDRTVDERRSILANLLQQGVCEVTFTKVNGELRTMPCTLDPRIVPPAPDSKILTEGETARVKKSNPDNMSVWCTDKNEWRSFKLVNVTEINKLDKHWTITVEEDPETGDLILPFPEDFLKETGWSEGDTLTWTDRGNGSWSLEKKLDETAK